MGGSNPIREHCPITEGCSIHRHWPKVEFLAQCLPDAKKFSDIDLCIGVWRGHVTHVGHRLHSNGYFLFLEWKDWPEPSPLEWPQHWLLRDLTAINNKARVSALCVAGDARTMTVHHLAKLWLGEWHPWQPTTTEEFHNSIKQWSAWAARRVQADADSELRELGFV